MLFRKPQPRVEWLAGIPLFASCTRKQLARVDSLATELILEPGFVLQDEDATASAFFVIVSGEATVCVAGRRVGQLHGGQFFGEVGVLDRGPGAATVTVATRIDVLVFSRQEFRALLEVAPAAAVAIMRDRAAFTRAGESGLLRHGQGAAGAVAHA